ncbi:hypothetical protein ABTX15_03595 [Micromonospora sp. NPDC094482]|uniref:hypothetical protein n=1 Tax=unclassified Micromonospora TaxID=2617518 RepID=UPI0033183E06
MSETESGQRGKPRSGQPDAEPGRTGPGLAQPGQGAQGRRQVPPERHLREGRWPAEEEPRSGEPDVLLDVPELRVGSIRLAVDGLDADLSLRARLANLLQLDAGVRVRLDAVELDITDVRAEALLKVRLERLMRILDRALDTIDQNPQIIEALAGSARTALDDADRAAQQLTGNTEQLGNVVDRLGRQVGSVAARAEWTGSGALAKGEPKQPSGGPGQPAGGAGQPQPAGGAGQPAGGAGQPAGGAGQPQPGGGAGQPAAKGQQRPGQGEAGGPPAAGQQPGPTEGKKPGPSEGAKPGPSEGRPGTAEAGHGWQPGRGRPGQPSQPGGEQGRMVPSPTDLAEQASEALRQAGRSVWEAIRSGMAQHGQPPQR